MRTALLLLLLVAVAGALEPEVSQSVRPMFFLSEWRVLDLDGDGRDDLLVIGDRGEVRSWFTDPATGKLEPRPRGRLTLPEPEYTLLAVADILGEKGPAQLVALSPSGAVAYRVGGDGAFVAGNSF